MVSVAAVAPVAHEPAPAEEASFDDHAADFFREGESAPVMATATLDHERAGAEHADADGIDPAIAAVAAERRRAFSRHVLGVVALSVVVCIAAFVRSATGAPASAAVHTTSTVALSPAVAELPRGAPLKVPTPIAAIEPAAASATAADTAPSAAEAVAREVAPIPARAAREDARRALDRGAAAAAIAAGTQSVELDPTDADAWLILGAAYQLAGKGAEARTAFHSCSKLARRGDVTECRALVP